MNYRQVPPDSNLKDFIRCYWWLDNTSDKDLDFSILPDGCFDLIIYFQNHQQQYHSLTGLWSTKTDVKIKSNTQLFGIQFRLAAVDYIFKKPIAPILNNQKTVNDDYFNLANISFQKSLRYPDFLNSTISDILDTHKKIDARKLELFKLLYQTKGNKTVAYYSEQVHWSSRQINRYFKHRFGLSLKAYCNILKCTASFKHLKKGQLAPEQNYFDTAHFIKAMKKHTGTTPKALFKNKNDRFLQLSILPKK